MIEVGARVRYLVFEWFFHLHAKAVEDDARND